MPETLLQLQDIKPTLSYPQRVDIPSFSIQKDQQWAIIGGNGSGKSTFAESLAGTLPMIEKNRQSSLSSIQLVSFELEQQLYEREIREDDSEFIDQIDAGRTTYELISEHLHPGIDIDSIIKTLQLEDSLHTGFRLLSTGERRRMMIARALSQDPQMLILDEPFDGLDIGFSTHLEELLEELRTRLPVVLVVNRMSQILDSTTHIACVHQMELVLDGPRAKIEQSSLWNQLQSRHTTGKPLPAELPQTEHFQAAQDQAIVDLRNLNVGYHNNPVIGDFDWKVMPGEHWQIQGPNGCGKSTLVNIISGDHPQCYSNEMYLFGTRRGHGESIWQVKKFMGLMSTTLHQSYRVTVTAETVLLSGFFDSIGVYRPVSSAHKKIAAEWLDFLGLSQHTNTVFQKLSFGQQRMLLIARSLIKRPYLLILDEPCQGLDPINRALVIQLIEEIAERKLAQILYISHEPEDMLKCITHRLTFVPKSEQSAENKKSPNYTISLDSIN